MGLLTVSQAVKVLREAGLRADRGYPGGMMPQIGSLAVAVNVEKADDAGVTLAATVCCPASLGSAACEDGAEQTAAAWTAAGASCSQGSCDYDGNSDLFSVQVLGYWTAVPVWGADTLRYKTFIWPENPERYRVESLREPEYVTDDAGVTSFSGLGERKRTVTGSGCFTGANAYTDFKALEALTKAATAGTLTHPVWGTMTAFFTGLTLEQEPRENYVAYSFTFREADSSGGIPQ